MIYEFSKDVTKAIPEVVKRIGETSPEELVAVTGAGISVESGLPLGNESYAGICLPEFFRYDLWANEPKRAFDAYRSMLEEWRKAEPNEAHALLARCQVRVITQNIDGLHRDAGSKEVIELHGNLRELICRECHSIFSTNLVWRASVPTCPGCGARLFPGIALEGDPVRHIARAVDWIASAKYVLIVGTQMNMEPIRRLREIAHKNNAMIVWICEAAGYWLNQILS